MGSGDVTFGDEPLTGMAGPRRSSRRLMYVGLAIVGCLVLVGVLIVVFLAPGRSGELAQQTRPGSLPAPVGIVTMTAQAGLPLFLIAFHDPVTGKTTRSATVPATGGTNRQHFSADFTMFAWSDLSGVHVARLAGTTYAETASWILSQNPNYRSTWDHAVVNPATGRVWFVERDTGDLGQGLTSNSVRVVSIDPNIAGDQPRMEQGVDVPRAFDRTGAPAREQAVPLVADSEVRVNSEVNASLVATDAQVISAKVSPRAGVGYECPAPLGPDVLICYTPASTKLGALYGISYGSVAEMRFDRIAQHVTMRQILAELDPPPIGLLVSPDGHKMLLRTETGWQISALPVGGPLQSIEIEGPADMPYAWI